MSILDRYPRRCRMLGGPYDGDTAPLPIPERHDWPAFRCVRQGAGPWQHYHLDEDRPRTELTATYVYAGECSPANHDGCPLPHEHVCCCGRPGCDGREMP